MAEENQAETESGGNRASYFVMFSLFLVIFILVCVIISMWTSVQTTQAVVNRPDQDQDMVFEEEQKTVGFIPFQGEKGGSGIMAYIRTGAEQTTLTLKIDLSLGISKAELAPYVETNIAPLQDRVLAYFSDKTKEDIIYLFQRKILGEEIKEILNAILDRELHVPDKEGRVTSVHVTNLTFQSL